MRKIMSLINTKNVLERIARDCNHLKQYELLDASLRNLLELCLSISPKERPLPVEILQNTIFTSNLNEYRYKKTRIPESSLHRCPLKQIYYWWQLAGGEVHSELKADGLIQNGAPILAMPKLVHLRCQAFIVIIIPSYYYIMYVCLQARIFKWAYDGTSTEPELYV